MLKNLYLKLNDILRNHQNCHKRGGGRSPILTLSLEPAGLGTSCHQPLRAGEDSVSPIRNVSQKEKGI